MIEFRLLPAALTCWAATLLLLLTRQPHTSIITVAIVVAGWILLRQAGQALLCGAVGLATIILCSVRMARPLPTVVTGRVAQTPRTTLVTIESHPILSKADLSNIAAGDLVRCTPTWKPSNRPSVSGMVGQCDSIERLQPATGLAANIHHRLHTLVDTYAPGHSLIPGMVLGDTSGQTPTQHQDYLDTGLSHLTAVSGSNVALVVAAVMLSARLLGLTPRTAVIAALATLVLFVGVVGFEPSVLRAATSGLLVLLAMVSARRVEPLHGLFVAIIGLILYDSNMAVSFGFALSIAATAGIVLFGRRAISIAVAADLSTMPLIALMTGKVSTVAIPANILAAPAVAPITVLGLLACIPGPHGGLALTLARPFSWWIDTVAHSFASLPWATIPMTPIAALLISGWALELRHAFDSRRRGISGRAGAPRHH